jgi:hypothetical protein
MIKCLAAIGLALMAGCTPGYIKSADLERKGQGPSACAKSCEDLGMRMTALVLVGDQLPGCVCQPVVKQAPISAPAPAPAATPESGAAASTTGFVVIAAAAAAQQQQQQQRQRQLQRQQQQQQR